jgi:cytochrome c6
MLFLRACYSLAAGSIMALSSSALPAAYAADTANGGVLFEAKCAACHAGGGNVLNPGKSLSLNTLQKNGYGSEAAIVELTRNGKGQMPKYQGAIPKVSRMTDEELADVAAYVLDAAGKGWNK